MAKIIDRIMRAGEGKILRELAKVVDKVIALSQQPSHFQMMHFVARL